MTAAEIDLDKWLWTLPAGRSKNKRARVTPLLGLARTIVAARIDDGLLFSAETGVPLTSASIGDALHSRRSKSPIAAYTTHDLRRTAATMMYEMGISKDVIGAVVGHGSDDKGSRTLIRHYLKSDLVERKARALEAWDAHLRAIVAGEPVDNVVRFHHG